jgi:hypothetical protein
MRAVGVAAERELSSHRRLPLFRASWVDFSSLTWVLLVLVMPSGDTMVSPYVDARVESAGTTRPVPHVVAVEKDPSTTPVVPGQPSYGHQQYPGMPQHSCPPSQVPAALQQYAAEGMTAPKPVPPRGMPMGVVLPPGTEGVLPPQLRPMQGLGLSQGAIPQMPCPRPPPHPSQRNFHSPSPNMAFPPLQALAPLTQVRRHRHGCL